MSLQTLPAAARQYGRDQRTEIGAAISAVNRIWRRMGDDFDASYAAIEPELLSVLDSSQRRIVNGSIEATPEILAATAPRALNRSAEWELAPSALIGTAGDGLPTESLAYGSVIHAKTAVKGGATTAEALSSAGKWLSTATGTLLSDTGRSAEKVTALARQNVMFVRMLQPPSCGRCIILAGKKFRNQQAFERHNGCDCRNIPADESIADDLLVNPETYLSTLSERDLIRALGSKANAEAWDLGADTNQLINAYRKSGGVRSAQVYGRTVKYTTEGTTRRGLAYKAMSRAGYAQKELDERAGRYFRTRAPRLMPESIFQIAENRADAKRLLRLYGWVN
ncbi:hypothetical protein GCM10010401_07310 [Rarobacter faecitabidus]|uniref:Phage Mu protein F like protein n=1 Tax=Rarobacter faecitabidus TaxID=13243 RepID=A0A542Z874_RARFA|nr:hypothetical protein [Rarobacter faecitabidus]TQL56535.1 hypothetical protein FB461_2424 [Rarobacter faecitabidus]